MHVRVPRRKTVILAPQSHAAIIAGRGRMPPDWSVHRMNKPERLGEVDETAATEAESVVNAVEGEIRDFVRRDIAAFRRPNQQPGNDDAAAENLASMIQRVSGASIAEVERVIAELSAVRDTLRNEGERVQRDIAAYAALSQAALTSTRIIADSLANWKPGQADHIPSPSIGVQGRPGR